MTKFRLNGEAVEASSPPETPLLWVMRDEFNKKGVKFGCGVGSCGACMVHINGQSTYSCITSLDAVADQEVTTIEGLSPDGDHPLQRAWVEEQTPQCGYCQSGQIMRAAELLEQNPKPTRGEIVDHMSSNLCRCGTYHYIIRAIERASGQG